MPTGTHDIISLTPLFIHNGPGMVPYLTLEWSGYSTMPQHRNPHHNHHDYSHRPPRHRAHQQQQQQHGNSKGTSSTSSNGSGGRQQPSHQQQKGGAAANGYNKGRNKNAGAGLGHSRSAVNLSQLSENASQTYSDRAVHNNNARGFSSTSAPVSPRDMNRHRYQHHRKPSGVLLDTLPALIDNSDDAPDLERFLKAATPCVRLPSGSAAGLRLSDVWRFYERPSVFGLECAALGGPRGPSNCYFVPYLSAVHIYNPVEVEQGVPMDEELFSFPQGLDSWPTGMRRGFSWAAAEHVADRLPLHTRVTELATRDGSLLGEHPLWSTKLADLHPYSWFAVAWYPLYRIPDAPLTARFLTFHSLAPLWEAATAAEREAREAAEAAAAAERSSSVGVATVETGGGHGSATSYKLMLETRGTGDSNGGPGSATGGGNGSETPTGLAPAYPGSPFGSETATRTGPSSAVTAVTATTTSGASAVSGSHSVISAPATGSDSASVGPSYGSLNPSPAASDAGDDRLAAAMAGINAGIGQGTLAAPAVGLCWHTAGSAAGENWTDTLVTVDIPADPLGRGLRRGDVLPGPANASVAGVWPRAAVIRKDYPLVKGGPLSWEIQLEELEEGARRLALQQGLMKMRPGGLTGLEENGEEGEPESCCPDYDFFSSRRR